MNGNELPPIASGEAVDKLKSFLNWNTLSSRLRLSKEKLIEIGLYFGVGFLAGFILHRYAYIVAFLILFIVGLIGLQQINLIDITIYWDEVGALLGMKQVAISPNIFSTMWSWVQLNVIVVISLILGFWLGAKIG